MNYIVNDLTWSGNRKILHWDRVNFYELLAQITADNIPATFLRHYPSYKKGQLNVSELARVCDLSRTTVYKYIDLLEA